MHSLKDKKWTGGKGVAREPYQAKRSEELSVSFPETCKSRTQVCEDRGTAETKNK